MHIITVKPIFVNPDGIESPFYDEMGTPEFYEIDYTLKKYLGEDIWVNIDSNVPTLFTIRVNCNNDNNDYIDKNDYINYIIKIIESIYELNTLIPIPIWPERCPYTNIKFEFIKLSECDENKFKY